MEISRIWRNWLLNIEDLVMNWGFGGSPMFILSDRLCPLNWKESNVFNKAKKASSVMKLRGLKKIFFFLFGIWVADSCQMCVVSSLLSGKSECHHLTLARLPGNEDERCVEQFVSIWVTEFSFHRTNVSSVLSCLILSNRSWGGHKEECKVSCKGMRQDFHIGICLSMHRLSRRMHKKLVIKIVARLGPGVGAWWVRGEKRMYYFMNIL